MTELTAAEKAELLAHLRRLQKEGTVEVPPDEEGFMEWLTGTMENDRGAGTMTELTAAEKAELRWGGRWPK